MEFEKAKRFMEHFLKTRLSPFIYYHDYFHTMDVLSVSIDLAKAENINDDNELIILKTAALFHDCGFTASQHNHEEEGCRIARENLPDFDYSVAQVNEVCKLIMATKMPQNPGSLLERILCDSDLDYLGREDYEINARKLYDEWKQLGKIQSEQTWISMQVNFLETHHYWTKTAIDRRQKAKEVNLKKLKQATV